MTENETTGDLASRVARELEDSQAKQLASFEEETKEEQTPAKEGKFRRFKQFSFRWRIEDQMVVSRIQAASDSVVLSVFSEAITAVDNFWSVIRVPEVNEETGEVLSANGRVVWQRDENGGYVQDLSRASNDDLEGALVSLAMVKIDSAKAIADLFQEAVFAKHVFDDSTFEHISKAMDGTDSDKRSKAITNNIEHKYMAFFTFSVWDKAKRFQDELDNLERILERVRNWRSWDRRS